MQNKEKIESLVKNIEYINDYTFIGNQINISLKNIKQNYNKLLQFCIDNNLIVVKTNMVNYMITLMF